MLRRVVKNSVAMLGSNIVLRGGDLLVAILAARRLPVEDFGKYMLVLSFYSLFRLAGDGGMQHLIIREMAQDKVRASLCFSDALGFQLVWSALLAAIYVGSVLVFGYSGATLLGLLIALVAMVPDNLALPGTSAIQAYERLEYLFIVNGVTTMLRVAASVVVLLLGYGFLTIVGVMAVSRALGFLAVQWLAVRRILIPPFRTSWPGVIGLTRRLFPFLAITLVSAIFLRVDTILLSRLSGDTAVAIFAVGMRLSEPAILIAGSFALAIYPTLAATLTSNRPDFVRLYVQALRGTILAALIVIGIGDCLAPLLVVWLFGPAYAASIPVLKVFLWYLAIFGMEQVTGRVLLAAGRQDVNLKVISVGTVLMVIFMFVLAPRFGPVGAALADSLALAAIVSIELVIVCRLVPEMDVKRSVLIPGAGLVAVWTAGQLAARWGVVAQLTVVAPLSVAAALLTGLVKTGDVARLRALALGWRAGRPALVPE